MLRRDFLAGASAAVVMKPERRNVLLLIAEQLQHNAASFAGGPAQTPNLDNLAASAVQFHPACTTTGLCSPARAALFTGRLGHRTGLDDNCNVWRSRLTGVERGDAGWEGPDETFYRYEWYNGLWFGIRAIRIPEWK